MLCLDAKELEFLDKPFLVELFNRGDVEDLLDLKFIVENVDGAAVHHSEIRTDLRRRVEDEAERITHTLVLVGEFVSKNNVTGDSTGKLVLKVLDLDVGEDLVNNNLLCFGVDLHCVDSNEKENVKKRTTKKEEKTN